MVTVMDTVTGIQNLDVAVCISHSANIVGKGMHSTFLTPTPSPLYGNQSGRRKTEF